MSDFFDFSYNNTVNASFQGQLSSSYSSALSAQVKAAADYIAFMAFEGGTSVADALAIKAAIEGGNFSLTDLFGAAQSKTGTVPGASIVDPDPKIIVNGTAISLKSMLSGLETETWTTTSGSGKKLDATYHTREFYSSAEVPSYDHDWAVQNHTPTATAITADFTEDQAGPSLVSVNLLSTASDADAGDVLSVVAGSVNYTVNGIAGAGLPAYMTLNGDGTISVDTTHDLYATQKDTVVVSYKITDGHTVIDNTATITHQGTVDSYSDDAHFSFVKTGSSVESGERHSAGSLILGAPEGAFDFSGTVTVSGNADLNGRFESLVVTGDGQTLVNIVGLEPQQGNGELLTPYSSGSVAVAGLSDGALTYDILFSQQVQNGSTVNIDVHYSYLA